MLLSTKGYCLTSICSKLLQQRNKKIIIDMSGDPERLDRSISLLSNFFSILSYLERGELAIDMFLYLPKVYDCLHYSDLFKF